MLTLLLVEDDQAIREMLVHYLRSKQFELLEAEDVEQAQSILDKQNPDLLLVDWMLPDQSGLQLIRDLRDNPVQKEIPVIMLTARSEEVDMIKGLDVGADDYLTKPVSLEELHARIRALLRRSQGLNQETALSCGPITLDPVNHTVQVKNQSIKIGQTEFRLLHYLMRKPDRLHSRAQLLDQVWGQGVFIEERTVDVHILRLRKLLKPFGLDGMVRTVRGAGYRFSEKDDG